MYGVRNETMDHKDLRLWLMLTQTTCLAAFCLYCMCIGEDLLLASSWKLAVEVGSSPVTRTKEHTWRHTWHSSTCPAGITQLKLSSSMQLQQVCSFPPTEPGEEIKNCYQRGRTASGFHKPTENLPIFNLQYSVIRN